VDGVVVALTVGQRTFKVRAERYGGRVRRRGGQNSDGSDATEDGIETWNPARQTDEEVRKAILGEELRRR
jgi:hypothetical protein